MQVSAQPRFIDHATQSVYNRGARRPPNDGGSRRFNDRSDEERRRTASRPQTERAPIAAAAPPGPEALWTLAGLEARPPARGPDTAPSQAESLYLLLSQVVGDL